ncbi:MAG: hypothetical protein LLG01_12295 [Planctomycetaceae bacterium]|nr:hypothetical protein [Planctomycetaceae bacterium]
MRHMNTSIILGLAAVTAVALSSPAAAEEAGGPFENIKAAPVAVTWQYSTDGGKTFANAPQPGPPAGPPAGIDPNQQARPVNSYVWKGTFDVADPTKIAGLWVRIAEEGPNPRASICTGDLIVACGGYWKDLGFCPTLLNATITLNGKSVKLSNDGVLVFWAPLEGPINKGANTVEIRGSVYTYWGSKPAKGIDARLLAAEPQPAKIINGPILGDFGDGYFTLCFRTQMPAEATVEATPDGGAAVTVSSVAKIWHRMRVEVPKGTKKATYTVMAKVGVHQTKSGPYTVEFPGSEYTFIAFGNVGGNIVGVTNWTANARRILKARPAFIVNTGNLMEQGSWTFNWDELYITPAGELMANIPTLITPSGRDFVGMCRELYYTPAPDGLGHNWSKAIGPVRFIGIDRMDEWQTGGGSALWLEKELRSAKEKFVVVLCGIPGYASGKNSRGMERVLKPTRDVILPLLGKYKATLMLASWDPDYERCEPTPDKGVTQICTGCIGKVYAFNFSRAQNSNPFGPKNKPNWVGFVAPHCCVFEVKGDTMEMRVLGLPGHQGSDDMKNFTVKDRKTFKARN